MSGPRREELRSSSGGSGSGNGESGHGSNVGQSNQDQAQGKRDVPAAQAGRGLKDAPPRSAVADAAGEGAAGGEGGEGQSAGADRSKSLPRPTVPCPCARCESLDTKFCYYNNYNIKQPRYFCKARRRAKRASLFQAARRGAPRRAAARHLRRTPAGGAVVRRVGTGCSGCGRAAAPWHGLISPAAPSRYSDPCHN